MKIHLVNDSKQGFGGGWTFMRNIEKGLAGKASVTSLEESDVVLVSGATMVSRDTVDHAKSLGKKLVLRVDNIPRNSRNRNTGTSRLLDFARKADAVVYQSQWAKDYVQPFIQKDGRVILNGCDTDVFNTTGAKHQFSGGQPVYLYSRFSRDETKRWEEAWYRYQIVQRQTPRAKLVIVGSFSEEQVQYNFDFYMNENIEYMGVVADPQVMAEIYRGADYFTMTYYNDACSNTLIEAICCGMSIVMVSLTGGTPEILQSDPSHFTLERMANDYMEVFNELL